ncbi:MAG: aquaporin [Acidobacteria bacterium]|nr:aquaporin [Acidobacteriota bacterium]
MKKAVAEFLGTFFLTFAGIAAILSTTPAVTGGGGGQGAGLGGLVAIALAHGLALSVAVNAFGGISGAHINPAVTAGMLVTGRIPGGLAVTYIVSQLAGATIAAMACRGLFPADAVMQAKLGIPLPAAWATTGMVLGMEFILTFLLVTAVFGTAVDDRGAGVKIGGFGIGLTVTFDILAGGRVTGASMNPARSFGPALVLGDFSWHWAYWVAPIAGGCVAALLYHHVLLERK